MAVQAVTRQVVWHGLIVPDHEGYDWARDDAAFEGVFGWEEPRRPLRGLNFQTVARRQNDQTRDCSRGANREHAPASTDSPSSTAGAGARLPVERSDGQHRPSA